jgi:hypothetical protein
MNNEIIEIAATVLQVTTEDAMKHSKPLPDLDATYFWKPSRGGSAVIIKSNGEKLAAGSSISLDAHKQAFLDGKRN